MTGESWHKAESGKSPQGFKTLDASKNLCEHHDLVTQLPFKSVDISTKLRLNASAQLSASESFNQIRDFPHIQKAEHTSTSYKGLEFKGI